jgi:hypothetical protein
MQQAVSLTEAQVDGLVTAYIERKKFETKVMLSIVAEALKPKEQESSFSSLAGMGFGIRGA